jgi:hypothetical protein
MMHRVKVISSILILLICVVADCRAKATITPFSPQVEITDVRKVGISAADATKTVIEVRWQANVAQGASVKSFELALEVTYADGATVTARSSVGGTARSGRGEVPTTHLLPGHTPAEIKSIKASITTTFTETVTKQVPA